jgi:hypothetical protein
LKLASRQTLETKNLPRKLSNKKVTEEIHAENLNFENTRSKACGKNPLRRITHDRPPAATHKGVEKGTFKEGREKGKKIPGEKRYSPPPGSEKNPVGGSPQGNLSPEASRHKDKGRTREQQNQDPRSKDPPLARGQGTQSTKNLTGKKAAKNSKVEGT